VWWEQEGLQSIEEQVRILMAGVDVDGSNTIDYNVSKSRSYNHHWETSHLSLLQSTCDQQELFKPGL